MNPDEIDWLYIDPKEDYSDGHTTVTGKPGSGGTLAHNLNVLKRILVEDLEKETKEKEIINNPNTSSTELFEIASTSKFPENVKNATKHPNFNMEKYLEEFCDISEL